MAGFGEQVEFNEVRPLPVYNTDWGTGWLAEGARGAMAPDPATVAPRPMVERALADTFGIENPVMYAGKYPVLQEKDEIELV